MCFSFHAWDTGSVPLWLHMPLKGLHAITWSICGLYCESFWATVLSSRDQLGWGREDSTIVSSSHQEHSSLYHCWSATVNHALDCKRLIQHKWWQHVWKSIYWLQTADSWISVMMSTMALYAMIPFIPEEIGPKFLWCLILFFSTYRWIWSR
jgi:hypothetical protein